MVKIYTSTVYIDGRSKMDAKSAKRTNIVSFHTCFVFNCYNKRVRKQMPSVCQLIEFDNLQNIRKLKYISMFSESGMTILDVTAR